MNGFIRLCILSGIVSSLVGCKEDAEDRVLFERLDSAQTNVGFVNQVTEKYRGLTVLDYLYYYNGGGVGCGDINNDGLQDLFFVSNQGPNRLYLNKGNFQFEDITAKAGVAGFSQWKTGVVMVDINGDGWLDFYVCALGNFKGIEGSNELYINNGDNTFTEKSADVGLDFSGMATQSLFFDYDRDGDLDMYLVTHAPHTARSYDRVMAAMLTDKVASDRLFRNDDGIFKDVTEASGIDHDKISYGMSAAIADIDADGWDDIYVANDFYEEDACYINQHNGTFVERSRELFDYGSRYAHGVDVADINNDGYVDIMTTDIRASQHEAERKTQADDSWETFNYKKVYNYPLQFSKNTLQVNQQGLGFSEIGGLMGISSTGWTWSVLMADFNNDGWKDIFTTNGIPKALTDIDYLEYAHKDSIRYALELSPTHVRRALDMMPESKEHNFIFENRNGRFTDQSLSWGFDKQGFSNGAAYADLDNDGDLDIVTNEMNGPAGLFRNNTRQIAPENHFISISLEGPSKNTRGIGAKIFVKTAEGFQIQHVASARGFLSSACGPLIFGLGKHTVVDSVIVVWNDQAEQVLTQVQADTQISLDHKNAVNTQVHLSLFNSGSPLLVEQREALKVPFPHRENEYFEFYREPLIPFLISREGPALATADVNGDGLEDFFVGGAKHQAGEIYIQQLNGQFTTLKQPALEEDSIFEDVDALWVDVDGDKNLDLYVVSGGNDFYGEMDKQLDRLYLNDGKGNLSRDRQALPLMFQNKSCVSAADIDNDGDVDLFVGGRVVPFHYGAPATSYLLINDGHGKFKDATSTIGPELASPGMITDAQWGDLDNDGDPDLVVSGEWMSLKVFINNNGKLTGNSDWLNDNSVVRKISGFWQCVMLGDFDKDGDLDIVAGNMGLNTLLQENGTTSLRLFVDVAEPGGKPGPVMTRKERDGKYYPLAQRSEWQKVMPENFARQFPSASVYAAASMDDLQKKLKLSWKSTLDIDQLSSVYFENDGKGKFICTPLPDKAQWSEIFAITQGDINGDGHIDLVTGGNNANVSPMQGAYMADKGAVLLGDGHGNFSATTPKESGLFIRQEIRNIRRLRIGKKDGYLVGVNNDSLRIFSTTK